MPHSRSAWLRLISLASLSVWLLFTVLSLFAPMPFFADIQWYLIPATLTIFSLAHALRRYDTGKVLTAFTSAAVIATGFEQLSISTGIPFGYYVHTPALGVKIFSVPIIIGPIFFSLCYLAWSVVQAVIGPLPERRIEFRIVIPIIAACIATTFDMCSDPVGATISRSWIYRESGAYFGVPLSNYFGWLVTTWVITQVFEIIFHNARQIQDCPPGYWYEPCIYWGLLGLQYPVLFWITPASVTVHDSGGWPWTTEAVLGNAAVVGVCCMIMTALLGALAVRARIPGASSPT